MTLALSHARYAWHDGHPTLHVDVDGRPAVLIAECKPTLHAAGLVFVGIEFAGVLPAIEFRPPDGAPLTLRGFSRDGRLFRLYDAFGRACGDGTFEPGPVAIPD